MSNFYLFISFCIFFLSSLISGRVIHHDKNLDNNFPTGHVAGNVLNLSGLVFEKEFEYRQGDNQYSDIIQLKSLSNKAQALQFRLLVNESEDDSTILIFENIQKGSNINDTSWVLLYNVFKGQTQSNGASKDEIYVLLYNLNQANGLEPDEINELFKVNYKVADLHDLEKNIKSSMKIADATASTFDGSPIVITPSRDEVKIIVKANAPAISNGLVFAEDTVYRLEDDSYLDLIQLKGLTHRAQALQFKLLVNKAIDDKVILTFQNIQKGEDVIDPSWVLIYNVFRGSFTGNGASEDEIFVLLYNLNQNNGLEPGDHNNVLNVKYKVAYLTGLNDSIKSSIIISNTAASTHQGFPIDITPSRDELTIFARNRIGFCGDVNGDGCLDILDIIMIVDHIIGKDSLKSDELDRADIAPWVTGNELPDPDGVVNVQDLSLLQHIILTNTYPNGISINGCGNIIATEKNGGSGGNITLYINHDGITVYGVNEVDIRGIQIEFGNMIDSPNNMIISTDLGQGYYLKEKELLRVLLYDRKGERVIRPGEHLLAHMPFQISNLQDIKIEKLILIGTDKQKIEAKQTEIIYKAPPLELFDYQLFQNHPNPFNPSTSIRYKITLPSFVVLKVFDVLGEEIAVLVNQENQIGVHEVKFNAAGLSSGVYYYQLKAGSFVSTKKMILLR